MSIGERLRTLRKEAGLSQKQVAETLKMSKPIVSQYESNQRTPSLGKLIRFSRFYKKGELMGDVKGLMKKTKK